MILTLFFRWVRRGDNASRRTGSMPRQKGRRAAAVAAPPSESHSVLLGGSPNPRNVVKGTKRAASPNTPSLHGVESELLHLRCSETAWNLLGVALSRKRSKGIGDERPSSHS
jgi:hypothetical protein